MESWVSAVVAILTTLLGVFLAAVFTLRQTQKVRLERAEDLATRFREPLLQAAYNLQSRLYNIAKQDFLGRFLTAAEASQQERDYAVRNTLYLFGQYLAWVEIIRREAQYVDPRSRENNRVIVERLEHIRDRLADSHRIDDRPLRLFRGEQRAVGELMLVPVATPVGDLPRWECLGYASFVDKLTTDPKFGGWFAPLEEGIETLAKEAPQFPPRITEVQHALIDLIDVLDPEHERVPAKFRGKMSEGSA
jgi:hypothetical protein